MFVPTDNEMLSILWIGSQARPQHLMDLFGTGLVHELDARVGRLAELPTRLSTQVRNIMLQRAAGRGGVENALLVARQNMDAAEIEMSDMLVEDQNCGAMSYIDCESLAACSCDDWM